MSLDLSEQYDKIYRYCYFKVNDRCAAEDLAQETFLRYFSHTPYISRGKQLAYLYTIARNLCCLGRPQKAALPKVGNWKKNYRKALWSR